MLFRSGVKRKVHFFAHKLNFLGVLQRPGFRTQGYKALLIWARQIPQRPSFRLQGPQPGLNRLEDPAKEWCLHPPLSLLNVLSTDPPQLVRMTTSSSVWVSCLHFIHTPDSAFLSIITYTCISHRRQRQWNNPAVLQGWSTALPLEWVCVSGEWGGGSRGWFPM